MGDSLSHGARHYGPEQALRVALERGKTELEKAPTRHSLFFSSPETTV